MCIVTVGGSGVGSHLLRRVISAFPEAKERVPDLRMIVVAGPRIDPASLPAHDGLEIRPYIHELYRHLTTCDLAVIQGADAKAAAAGPDPGRRPSARCSSVPRRSWPGGCATPAGPRRCGACCASPTRCARHSARAGR